MKKLICLFLIILNSTVAADTGRNFSLGLGHSYGGLGVKYDINHDDSKYYLSIGTLGPIGVGYGLGWELALNSSKHSIGIYAGVLGGRDNDLENTKYFGPALTYRYYFSGYNESSWVIGASGGVGYADKHKYNDKKMNGLFLNLAYQF